MSPWDLSAVFGSLFVAGLAGSLHCVGMCGPILLAFHQAMGHGAGGGEKLQFLAYHAGRLWTYAMLGLAAGWAGHELRQAFLGWQRPLSVGTSAVVIVAGVAALGLIPGLRLDLSLGGCGFHGDGGWLRGILRDPRTASRLVVGAVMGLLPCGLVYAMLVVVSSLPSPLASALGMLAFGAGTLPALSAVVLGSRIAPPWLRARGSRIAALLVVGVGLFMLARSILVEPGMAHAGH